MSLMHMSSLIKKIMAERAFQDTKYGPVTGRGGHELAAWLLILRKELREAEDAAIHGGSAKASGRNSIRSELIQIAAVVFAALEQHGIAEPVEPVVNIVIDDTHNVA